MRILRVVNLAILRQSFETWETLTHLKKSTTKPFQFLERALAIQEQASGENHPLVAAILHDFAGLYNRQSKFARAEPLLLRELQIREKLVPPDEGGLVNCLNNLAAIRMDQGKYSEADPLYPLWKSYKKSTVLNAQERPA